MATESRSYPYLLPLLLLLLTLLWLWNRRKLMAVGVSYYTQTASPTVQDITEASFDGMNVANIAKLNAYPSTLDGERGMAYGVYDAYVRARAAGRDLAPYLVDINAALHSIYGP